MKNSKGNYNGEIESMSNCQLWI